MGRTAPWINPLFHPQKEFCQVFHAVDDVVGTALFQFPDAAHSPGDAHRCASGRLRGQHVELRIADQSNASGLQTQIIAGCECMNRRRFRFPNIVRPDDPVEVNIDPEAGKYDPGYASAPHGHHSDDVTRVLQALQELPRSIIKFHVLPEGVQLLLGVPVPDLRVVRSLDIQYLP